MVVNQLALKVVRSNPDFILYRRVPPGFADFRFGRAAHFVKASFKFPYRFALVGVLVAAVDPRHNPRR